MTTSDEQFEALGFTWDWDTVAESLPEAPAGGQSFDEATPRYVQNITAATGNPITVPEVQILHSGMTIGGRRLQDHNEVVDLLSAFRYVKVRNLRNSGSSYAFALDKKTVCKIHECIMRHEDFDPGQFRGEGDSGTRVSFNTGDAYCPTPADDGGELLRQEFDRAQAFINSLDEPLERAFAYYALAVRNCFFLDGNKRAALVMTNGLLIQAGQPAITVEPSRLSDLNEVIDEFWYVGDATPVMSALAAHSDRASSGSVVALRDARKIRGAQKLLAKEGLTA